MLISIGWIELACIAAPVALYVAFAAGYKRGADAIAAKALKKEDLRKLHDALDDLRRAARR